MIPHKPGVYIFKDSKKRILYVGKAVDLKSRVSSYFKKKVDSLKTAALAQEIVSTETIVVSSEIEALILEANLIKKYKPPYNIKLIDDKDFLYIKITKEVFPKIITARKNELRGTKKFFGPFPSSRIVCETLRKLRRIFPWCSLALQGQALQTRRACFYYHLGLCQGPCAGKISQKDYAKIIRRFIKFMEGKKDELISELVSEMESYSKEREYEKAGGIKKIIQGIQYLTSSTSIKGYLENPNFLENLNKEALLSLKKDLNLSKIPQRIEGYDISNIQGKDATGSMVVLTSGEIDKSQYRIFRIRMENKPNDVGMHKEMIRRRLKHKEWPFPDLIIVDGGRGQAKGVELEILNLKFGIPVFGLAKKMEWLYPPEGQIIKLSKRSISLKLLQKLRDESHRFAVNYHRQLHQRSILNMIKI